jgi:hypothetical protein
MVYFICVIFPNATVECHYIEHDVTRTGST